MSAKRLIGREVLGADGGIGRIKDVFFTERSGNVRYLAIEAGPWLESREILLAPQALVGPRPDALEFHTALSRHAVEHSPPVSADLPISRAYEDRLHGHYGWSRYWGSGDEVAGATIVLDKSDADVDPDLRSVHDVLGHHLHAADGEIGHLDDLLIAPDLWEVVHLVAKTRNWLPGRTVVLPRETVLQMRWDTKQVEIQLTREQIKDAPEYDDDMLTSDEFVLLSRSDEAHLAGSPS